MIRIAENLLTGGDIGNNTPAAGGVEIREHSTINRGHFYRLKESGPALLGGSFHQ